MEECPDQNPYHPYPPVETITETLACFAAGAAETLKKHPVLTAGAIGGLVLAATKLKGLI